MTLPDMNYEAIKREIMPILHQDHHHNYVDDQTGAVSRHYLNNEEKR